MRCERGGTEYNYHSKKQLLQIYRGPVARNVLNELSNVGLIDLNVGDLVASEIGTEKSSGVFSLRTIGTEDAVAQKWAQGIDPHCAQLKVFELER